MGRFSEFFSRRKKFEPEGHVVSGRLAEFRLMKLTRAVAGNALVLEGIRLPDPEEGGRREIDMVIATKNEILFVEQKHWSGRFEVFEDGEFLQHRNKGGEHSHATVAHRIARKARLLEEIHRERYPDNEMSFHVLVAMTHPRLEWPEKIPKIP